MNITDLFGPLDQIATWSNPLLTVAACIVVGYLLRFIHRFPNDAIPVVVILFGSVVFMFLADKCPANVLARVWHAKNLIVGLILGFVAWIAHNQVLSRVEDWVATKVPGLNSLLGKQPPTPPTPPSPPGQP